jgi:polyhydroxybutyrate depolymerase
MQQKIFSKMIEASDREGFIAVHPDGTGSTTGWNAGACCGEAASSNVDDVGFIRALLDRVNEVRCVDQRRVFVTGMSNGGFMSHRLACEMADRFAAAAPVAGVDGTMSCMPSRPVPILDIHGTADTVVPYGGGTANNFRSVQDSVAAWVMRDQCTGSPMEVFKKGDATCQKWSGCAGSADVELCTIQDGGHTWPGGLAVAFLGKTSTDLDATAYMWDFFKAHPMPVKP